MAKGTSFDVSARYIEGRVTIPKNTALLNTTFAIGGFVLQELQVLWPAGQVGLTGFRLMYQGVSLLPWNQAGVFVVGENERRIFQMGIQLNVNPIIQTQNLGTLAHTIYVVAKLTDVVISSDSPPNPDYNVTPITLG